MIKGGRLVYWVAASFLSTAIAYAIGGSLRHVFEAAVKRDRIARAESLYTVPVRVSPGQTLVGYRGCRATSNNDVAYAAMDGIAGEREREVVFEAPYNVINGCELEVRSPIRLRAAPDRNLPERKLANLTDPAVVVARLPQEQRGLYFMVVRTAVDSENKCMRDGVISTCILPSGSEVCAQFRSYASGEYNINLDDGAAHPREIDLFSGDGRRFQWLSGTARLMVLKVDTKSGKAGGPSNKGTVCPES